MRVERLRPEPRMGYVRGFISPEEAQHLIELGEVRVRLGLDGLRARLH